MTRTDGSSMDSPWGVRRRACSRPPSPGRPGCLLAVRRQRGLGAVAVRRLRAVVSEAHLLGLAGAQVVAIDVQVAVDVGAREGPVRIPGHVAAISEIRGSWLSANTWVPSDLTLTRVVLPRLHVVDVDVLVAVGVAVHQRAVGAEGDQTAVGREGAAVRVRRARRLLAVGLDARSRRLAGLAIVDEDVVVDAGVSAGELVEGLEADVATVSGHRGEVAAVLPSLPFELTLTRLVFGAPWATATNELAPKIAITVMTIAAVVRLNPFMRPR